MGVTNKFGYGADLYDVMWAGSKRDNSNAQRDLRDKVDQWNVTKERQYLSDNGMLPGRYYYGDETTLRSTPAWLNKGETPLGMMEGLAGWQTEEESQFQRANESIRAIINNEVGYNTEESYNMGRKWMKLMWQNSLYCKKSVQN